MPTVSGGIRNRLIKDSVYRELKTRLTARGWFASGRQHSPIDFIAEPIDVTTVIPPNTLALSTEPVRETDMELGSNLAELRWTMYVDFFAEDDSIGTDVIGDVAAILGGRLPSIGAGSRSVPVYDFSQATPTVLFVVQIEGVATDKAHDWPHAWLRHWQSCTFEVVDECGGDG